MILSTMGDFPLSITAILKHGRRVYATSTISTFDGERCQHATFAEVADNADRLAAALRRLGVKEGDRVGTFMWNSREHMEAYFAIPCMGAVLHTLNLRLFPEQLAYVINHADDKVVIVDDSVIPLLARILGDIPGVEQFIVVGDGDAAPLVATGKPVHRYAELLAAETPGFRYPDLDERTAAAMCYTSGTTGNPKGVCYSHRSTYLHSLAANSASVCGFTSADKILVIVPQFHANAWGIPYSAFLGGASLVMPGRYLQSEPLARMITTERPTKAAAVPTIWTDLYRYAQENDVDLSALQNCLVGGSAVPRALIERFRDTYGVAILQGWGMTETSPLCTVAAPPAGTPLGGDEELDWREKAGRVNHGVELRICGDDGDELPWDGESVGEIEVRGPWVTTAYWNDPALEKFHDGWLRTGDVGSVTPNGYVQISDRAKDVIKSGGEWISSVDLENKLMAHPAVIEAAVVAIPDPKWDERPLACVVVKPGAEVKPSELQMFLADSFAKWQLPENWAFIAEVPKTSVGKFDKKVLRARHEKGELEVEHVG
ncbi:MAG: long-chain fatty acid--CoA ligase [Acidimicrobiia bacterium]